jgi:hypothetical protein
MGYRHLPHSIRRPAHRGFSSRSLLCDRVASVDPIRVDVDGRGQVVDVRLEGLTADFALQIADAGFLLNGDGDGLLVVAEEALEGRREFLLL